MSLNRNRAFGSFLQLDRHPPRTGVVYIAVRILVYFLALVGLVLIFGTKQRGLIIAPPIALVGTVATWYLLGDTPADGLRRLSLSVGVGFVLGQLTWAFGYWNVAALVGGAGLWLGFYVLSGVAEHGASSTLDRHVALEYAVVALIGALVILIVARPWSA
ncbi:MAG: hypothetical protein NVSMB2_27060 [Chloroflexota bacterium]